MPANFGDLDDDDAAPRPSASGQASLAAGDVFDNRYRLVAVLGKGGAGTVWEAEYLEESGPRVVALKLVPIPSRTRAMRAHREISIGLGLDGPHFVRVYDAGIVPPFAYVSMERLHGEDLANRLDRLGRLGIDETLFIGRQLATAMSTAHAQNLVHRDLKPTNVFLARDASGAETVKVLDFGVAKRLGVDARVTASDTLLGAPQYAAPEQIQNARTVDTRADVWSIGAMMYRCLVGRRPFDGVGGALLATVLAKPHPPPTQIAPDLPAALDEVFVKALAKDPDVRFATVDQLVDALERVLGPTGPRTC
ncbi:MAG: serine/threonine protein kinase [Polyangiaceae bacterium]|nr:serine/threonine protein kinase [Polyangiaceae bacterium]